jgi:hypothetical protein
MNALIVFLETILPRECARLCVSLLSRGDNLWFALQRESKEFVIDTDPECEIMHICPTWICLLICSQDKITISVQSPLRQTVSFFPDEIDVLQGILFRDCIVGCVCRQKRLCDLIAEFINDEKSVL